MRLIDVNGAPHVLTEHQVKMMVIIGWITFLAAWMMNILNYKVHPSEVSFSIKKKMFIYICGKKYKLHFRFCCWSKCCTKGQPMINFTILRYSYPSSGKKSESDMGEDMDLDVVGVTEV